MYSYNKNNCNPCAFPVPIPGPQGPPGPVPQSAFRARKINQQEYQNNVVSPVTYEFQVFDLNDEYDVINSTFTPKQNGVYLVVASIGILANVADRASQLVIQVNGNTVLNDNEGFPNTYPFLPTIRVSGILFLNAGEKVTVSHNSTGPGSISSTASITHFEVARFPSPL